MWLKLILTPSHQICRSKNGPNCLLQHWNRHRISHLVASSRQRCLSSFPREGVIVLLCQKVTSDLTLTYRLVGLILNGLVKIHFELRSWLWWATMLEPSTGWLSTWGPVPRWPRRTSCQLRCRCSSDLRQDRRQPSSVIWGRHRCSFGQLRCLQQQCTWSSAWAWF